MIDDESPAPDAKADAPVRTSFARVHRLALWSMIGVTCIVVGYVTGMKADASGATHWLLPWSDWLGFVVAPFLPMLLGGVIALLKGRYQGEAHWAGVGTIIGTLSAPIGFFIGWRIYAGLVSMASRIAQPGWQSSRSVELAVIAVSVLATAAAMGGAVGAAAADAWASELRSNSVPAADTSSIRDVREPE